ncbi:MAG: hypothetical protein ACTSUQ_10575 [Candidatus Freyarchaeota archaeon]
MRKAEVGKKKYGREPEHLILIIMAAPRHVAKQIRRIAREKNIDLVIGKEALFE